MANKESVLWIPKAKVEKYDLSAVQDARNAYNVEEPESWMLESVAKPYETVFSNGNLITTAGLNRLASLLSGASIVGMRGPGVSAPANTVRLGVGDSNTAASASDTATNMSGGSNRYFAINDSGYPTVSGAVTTSKSTFGTGVANYAWNCWVIDITNAGSASSSSTAGDLIINRKVESLGTKTNTQTWILTVTITFASA